MPPQLLELALFLFFCHACGIDCVFYNSERACPPRISSILILLVPCFPTHPSPNPRTLVFYHHRFPLLLLISFPTSPSFPTSLPPSLSPSPKNPQSTCHGTETPKPPTRGLGVSERKGPLSRKDEWIFFFSWKNDVDGREGKGKGKGKGNAGEPVCGRRGGDVY